MARRFVLLLATIATTGSTPIELVTLPPNVTATNTTLVTLDEQVTVTQEGGQSEAQALSANFTEQSIGASFGGLFHVNSTQFGVTIFPAAFPSLPPPLSPPAPPSPPPPPPSPQQPPMLPPPSPPPPPPPSPSPPPSTSPPACPWELPRQSACQNQGANQAQCSKYFYPKNGKYFQCRWSSWEETPKCIGKGPQCDPKSQGTTSCNCLVDGE